MARRRIEIAGTPSHLALFHGAFGPISPALRSYKIIGFDSEDDSKGIVLSFAFHDGVNSFYTRDANEALEYIYTVHEIAVFVAHNLEYDIANLFKGCDYKYVNEMVYAAKLLKVTLIGTRNYFLNSSNFFAGSLAKMGGIVGIPKLDGDPLNPEYNIRDAQIVQVFMSRFQARLHRQRVNLGVSIGQLAMSTYRANFLPTKQITYNSPKALNAYYGGRVEMFYKGIVEGPVYVCDINSCYPYVMRNFEYPDTSFIEESSVFTHQFGFGEFTIYVPESLFIPPLPYKSETGRLFFPTGKIRGWWTYAEVRYALDQGCTLLEEHYGEGCNRGIRPFNEFIDSLYLERIAHKRNKEQFQKMGVPEDDPDYVNCLFEELFLKLQMNNLYGKFAQHKPSRVMTRTRMSENKLVDYPNYKEHKVGPFYAYTFPREQPPRTANYLWGIYVTSYARIYLHKQIMAVHNAGSRVVYCDTDSVMFTGMQGIEALSLGKELGQLDKEEYDLGVFRQAKGYLLCKKDGHDYVIKKVACKGVPTHQALEFIAYGMARAIKPVRLKEGLIRTHALANVKKGEAFFKEIGVNVWHDVEKWARSLYIKRRGDQGVTYPVDVGDIPDLEEHVWTEPTPLPELNSYRLRYGKAYKDPFSNVEIPADWFSGKKQERDLEQYFSSQKIHFLKVQECLDLKPGQVWFTGHIVEFLRTKFGLCFKLFLKNFKGEKVADKAMVAAISTRFFVDRFSEDENFLGKWVAFFLESPYILGQKVKLKIELRESGFGSGDPEN